MKKHNCVLIVDDEPKIIEVVRSLLENKDYTVFSAGNGKDAMAVFDRENISLVLLDLMLPDIPGEELCTIIRQRSRVPIIMLTAKVQEEDMLKGLGVGADDYITKPFSLKELLARVEAVLRRYGDNLVPLYNKTAFNGGDLEIDLDAHIVKKRGNKVTLTPNEYKLLATLIKYPSKVFTREEIIEITFGNGYDGFSRTIDSHIKNLRHKIESNPKEPIYIKTIYGVGYKFGGE